jgi:hypothetical protein
VVGHVIRMDRTRATERRWKTRGKALTAIAGRSRELFKQPKAKTCRQESNPRQESASVLKDAKIFNGP